MLTIQNASNNILSISVFVGVLVVVVLPVSKMPHGFKINLRK